jgi:hypothetical protein
LRLRTAAIKPIFALLWDFDGVGQLITTRLPPRREWMPSRMGESLINCDSGDVDTTRQSHPLSCAKENLKNTKGGAMHITPPSDFF